MTAVRQKMEFILEAETELRCEACEGETLILKLLDGGSAEIFGVEMAPNKEYRFSDENFAVFTWYGCKIEANTNPTGTGTNMSMSSVYKADSTPNIAYVNTHAQLEARRDVALANQDYGPRVLIVGDVDHGKSTTSRMLAAYSARLDRTPILVDLDVGQGNLSITGTLTAVQVDKGSLSIEEGYINAMPLVYFFGYSAPKDNMQLYKVLIDTIAEKVRMRMDNDLDAKSSGLVINTCGWVEGSDAYDVLFHIIKAFQVDVILVMSNDKLYAGLVGLSSQGVTVVKLPTSGGIVRRDQTHRRRSRKNRIKEYFYGKSYLTSLAPARLELKLSSIKFLRAGGYLLSEGMRSLGDEAEGPSTTKLEMISPTVDLLNSCVAVLNYLNKDDYIDINDDMMTAELMQANVAGFIVIVQINIEQNSMTILSPSPGILPSKYLLVGAIKWSENK